jgi:DNA-binding transcriptional regulator YiaG
MGADYVHYIRKIFFILNYHFNTSELDDVGQTVNDIIDRCFRMELNRKCPIPLYDFESEENLLCDSVQTSLTRSLYLCGHLCREEAVEALERISKFINKRKMRLDAEIRDQENKETDYVPVKYVTLEFSRTLINARNAKGWKQSELASKMNVTLQDVKGWENYHSKARPKLFQIQKLNRLLSVVLPSL